MAAKLAVLKQLRSLAAPTFGCVGMVHKEFNPFPFPNLNRTELLTYATKQFVSRLGRIGLTGPAEAHALEQELSKSGER